MIEKPMDILKAHPVRKSKRQKAAFRVDVLQYLGETGYECTVEKGRFGAVNVVAGDPNSAKYLVTAHYDTCAHLPFPNLITPCSFVGFLGYQLLVTALMFLIPIAVGLLVGWVTQIDRVGFSAGYAVLWIVLGLMMFGPANKNNANDNTSGVVTVLEIAKTLPEHLRSKVCFVLFDLEESGLIGSASYRKAHKAPSNSQIILNLDCVGDGDEIRMFPTKKLSKNKDAMEALDRICTECGEKSVSLHKKGFSVYPSDQKNFPLGVGIAAFHRVKFFGLYCSRIHTNRDTVLEMSNVNILRAALISYISHN